MKSFKSYAKDKDLTELAKKEGLDIAGIDLEQLKMGYEVEKEHDGRRGKDTDVVTASVTPLKIAVAHLRELPDYYTRLKKMEGD
jgi:hypothetical protein